MRIDKMYTTETLDKIKEVAKTITGGNPVRHRDSDALAKALNSRGLTNTKGLRFKPRTAWYTVKRMGLTAEPRARKKRNKSPMIREVLKSVDKGSNNRALVASIVKSQSLSDSQKLRIIEIII